MHKEIYYRNKRAGVILVSKVELRNNALLNVYHEARTRARFLWEVAQFGGFIKLPFLCYLPFGLIATLKAHFVGD